MPTSFSLNIDELRGSGGRLRSLGDGLDSERAALESAIAGDAGAWGTGDGGASFGSAHQEAAELAGRAVAAIARGLGETGSALVHTADDVAETDREQADRLRALLARLDARP